jgi:hypothetical protein
MKINHRILFLICISLLPDKVLAKDDDYLIWVEKEPDWLSPGLPRFYEYAFAPEQLPAKVSWNPEQEKFPIDLSTEATRAKSFLSTTITNPLNLSFIDIEQMYVPGRFRTNVEGFASGASNQWYLVFTFSTPEGEQRCAVALLDGKYAHEKPGTGEPPDIPLSQDSGKRIPEVKPPRVKRPNYDPLSPIEKLQAPNFQIPTIQWPLIESRFPLDMDASIARTKDYLSKAKEISESELKLEAISFSRYFPDGAIQSKSLKLMDNFHHWFVRIQFRDDSGEPYSVPILLDGTILGVESPKL